jgi:hypothetical protein
MPVINKGNEGAIGKGSGFDMRRLNGSDSEVGAYKAVWELDRRFRFTANSTARRAFAEPITL